MFIATMYSYGRDGSSVGVDGIRGCMGVFLSYGNMLYAIHVPDSAMYNEMGRDAFVNYVKLACPGFVGDRANLYAVLNGTNRSAAAKELVGYCTALKIGQVSIIRLIKNLGVQGHQQDAAAVICEFIPNSTTCRFKYQRASDVTWIKNAGTVRAGSYHNPSFADILSHNGSLASGFHLVDDDNSTIEVKDYF